MERKLCEKSTACPLFIKESDRCNTVEFWQECWIHGMIKKRGEANEVRSVRKRNWKQ